MIEPLTILFFIAFCLGFYALAGMLQERYQRIMQASFVPTERKQKNHQLLHRTDTRRIICIILGILGAVGGLNFGIGILGVVAGGLAAGLGPYIVLGARARKRQRQLEAQIIPMLNMLANSMKAGKTLPQAIDDASQNLSNPMGHELAILARQIMVGVQVEAALREFQQRIDSADIKLAVRSMVVSIHTGADLPSAMKQIAQTIGERSKVNGKIRTLTTQGKMQGLIMGAAPFVLLGGFYLMDPSYEEVMFNTWQGNVVLGFIIGLQAIAFVMIQKIIKVKV